MPDKSFGEYPIPPSRPAAGCEHRTMAELPFFDANCGLGASGRAPFIGMRDAGCLLEYMDRCGIAEALVYDVLSVELHAGVGNSEIVKAVAGQPRLHPAWVALPHHTGEMPPPRELVKTMLDAGARAARMLPRVNGLAFREWCVGELLAELDEHRIPLFVDFGTWHWADPNADWDGVHWACSTFPDLPIIMVHEQFGSARQSYPLLARHPNLHLELSGTQTNRGVEQIARRFGARHLLFGTQLPFFEAGPALATVGYLELSEEDKRAIAGDNLRRLLEGVR